MCDKKYTLQRRSVKMDEYLQRIVNKIKENGYLEKIDKIKVERLMIRSILMEKLSQEIIKNFEGIKKVNPEVERWMNG